MSRAQQKACYAKDDPNWDCHEWSHAGPVGSVKKKGPTENFDEEEGEEQEAPASPVAAPSSQKKPKQPKLKGPTQPKAPQAAASGSAEAASRVQATKAMTMPQAPVANKAAAKRSLWQYIGQALGIIDNEMGPRHETGRFQPPGAGSGKGPQHAAAQAGHKELMGEQDDEEEEEPEEGEEVQNDDNNAGAAAASAKAIGTKGGGEGTPTATLKKGKGQLTETYDDSEEGKSLVPNNFGGPMMGAPSDPHQATKQAAAATLHSEHDGAMEHATAAMGASKDDNSQDAQKSHIKAAGIHEKAATDSRKGNDPSMAMQHDDAAALHRKAASMHAATFNQDNTMKLNRALALKVLTANCKCKDSAAIINKMTDDQLTAILNANAPASMFKAGGGKGDQGAAAGAQETPEQVGGEEKEGYAGEEAEEDANPEPKAKAHKAGKAVSPDPTSVGNASAAEQEYLNNAPPRLRNILVNSLRRDEADRQAIIVKLTANISDPAKKAVAQKALTRNSLEELMVLNEATPAVNQRQPRQGSQQPMRINPPLLMLPAGLVDNSDQDDDILQLPTMNYAEEIEEEQPRRKAHAR